jgi:hypothetical protein
MKYNATGEPQVRVHVDGISLEGDVIVDTVSLSSSTLAALESVGVRQEGTWTVSIGTNGQVVVSNFTSTVNIASLPAITGTVAVSNFPTSVTVTNFTSTVNIASMPAVSGTVAISSLPAVTGTVTVNGSVTVTNFTSTVNIASLPAITGTVTVSNFTSTVRVDNFPTSITVTNFTSTVNISSMPAISGTVSVSNFTSTIFVSNTLTISNTSFAVTNFPTTSTVYQGNSPWNITGTVVSSNFTSTVQVSNTVTISDGGGSITVDGNVTVTQSTGTANLVKYINTPNNLQMDMTQRLRVAAPSQSWWYAPTVDKDGDLRYIESYTGTNAGSVFVQNLASINMTSGTGATGSFIRISRRRHKMRPGVSMSAAFSINWNGWVPDGKVTKRAGLFTNFNGLFYEMTDDLQAVIRRRLTDGTLVEQRIRRENFNIDVLDGTGETGYDLRPVVSETSTLTNFVSKTAVPITGDGTVYRVVYTVANPSAFAVSKKGRITGVIPELYNGTVLVTAINGNNVTVVYTHDPGTFSSIGTGNFVHTAFHHHYTFGFDFNGNRTTSVRFFMDGPLGRVAIHQEDFGGELGSPFSNAPAVSTRYEIFNSAAPGRMPAFSCSSEVINVEAELELNPGFGVATNNTPVTYAKGGTATHPVLGIALRAGEPYQRSDLQLQGVTFADIANINQQNSGVFYWRLVLNPTIGGTVPASIDVGKSTRYWKYTAATTVSGGIDLISGYASSTQQFDVRTALNFVNLGSNIEYTDSDKIVLVVQQLVGGTADAQLVATVNFIESL